MKIRQLVYGELFLVLHLHIYALVLEKEQNFIRGREKSDRGREVGEKGEGSGGKGGGNWEWDTPLSTPS